MKKSLFILLILSFLISFATAEYSIDITGLKSEDYNIGEEINFQVILLDNEELITENVIVTLTDALNKKEISKEIVSNSEYNIKIAEDFLSGLWTINANFKDTKVERTFTISEESRVEFTLAGDELTIKNTGNTRYTKTIIITIGGEKNSYVQNIGINEEKILKLISSEGTYEIEVTDGTNTLKRSNVQLFGTGNVVGAVDKNLVGYTGFAGADDPRGADEKFITLDKLPLSLVFIGAVAGLAVLVFVERKLTKNKPTRKAKK